MTLADQVLLSVHTVIAFLLLWLLVFVLRRSYCEDKFRQMLFALRDELFDYAHSGAIGFDNPAYTLLRTRMNGMIRFAHRATWTHLFLAIFVVRNSVEVSVEEYHQRWQDALSSVSKGEVRVKLMDFQDRMHLLLAQHLVRSSLILTPALVFLFMLGLIGAATIQVWRRLSDRLPGLEYLEAEAEQVGAL